MKGDPTDEEDVDELASIGHGITKSFSVTVSESGSWVIPSPDASKNNGNETIDADTASKAVTAFDESFIPYALSDHLEDCKDPHHDEPEEP